MRLRQMRPRLRWPRFRWRREDTGQEPAVPDFDGERDSEGASPSAALVDEDVMVLCQGVVKIYQVDDLETVALQGLDLVVRRGEIVAIVGNSGSGKSTLLNLIGGLDRPSAGRIVVNGRDLLRLDDDELAAYRRSEVGFVWQESGRNLVPYLPARENIVVPMLLANVPPAERDAWADDLLRAVGLGDRVHFLPGMLSGGEQQRVAIAVAMANRPRLLLADEPTGELDGANAAHIYGMLRELSRVYQTTCIIVSHDPSIARHVDRVVAVRDGKISTETRRVTRAEETVDEELVVLDAAYRLQLPAALVEQVGLGDRVRVEVEGDHIVIRPATSTPHARSS